MIVNSSFVVLAYGRMGGVRTQLCHESVVFVNPGEILLFTF